MTVRAALDPTSGYWGRMRRFIGERHPPLAHLLFAAMLYTDLDWLVRGAGSGGARSLGVCAAGIVGVFTIMLLARLVDELKDESTDRRIAPHRPLPSGRVRRADIERSSIALIALYVGLNLAAGAPCWAVVAVLVSLLLSHRHCFMRERLERSVTLTLLTHAPLAFAVLGCFAVFALEAGGRPWEAREIWAAILPVSMFWTMIEGVEVARKIRAPGHETARDTYSKAWGPLSAVLVAAALQTWTLAAGLCLSRRLGLPPLFAAVLLAGYGIALFGHRRFLKKLTAETSRLDRYAQAYAVSILLALCVAQGLHP